MAASEATGSNVHAVKRALTILEFIDGSPREWCMSEIGRKLGIPKSTAHMLVGTLEQAGYLERSPGSHRYALGLRALSLGQGVGRRFDLAKLSSEPMNLLAERTKLTVHLAVRDGSQAIYIQKASGSTRFDTYVGKRINLHCTAVGKVILAYEGPRFFHEILTHGTFSRHTVNTITSAAGLQKSVDRTFRRGCAVDDEEEELDVRCLSVPILSRFGEFIGALGIAGTTGEMPNGCCSTLIEAMKHTASTILHTFYPQSPMARHQPLDAGKTRFLRQFRRAESQSE